MSKRLNRRGFLKLAGVTSAGLALASCAPPAAPPATTQPPIAAGTTAATAAVTTSTGKKFKKTDLSVPSWWGPHEIAGAEKSFNTDFKAQTGISVKYDFIGSDFNAKVFTSLASDNPYDVITFNA